MSGARSGDLVSIVGVGGLGHLAVQYAVITGSVAIAVTGLPTDVDGSMRLSGPNGYTLLVGKTITITGLVPGAYQS